MRFDGLAGSIRVVPLPAWGGSEEGAGRTTVAAIEAAVELCMSGQAGAVVTGPAHKPSLQAAGWRVPGQTEMLQQLSGSPSVGMLMCAERTRLGGPMRVLLATTHIPLEAVSESVTTELLVEQGRLLDRSLRDGWRLEHPEIALCALNPHASDDGLFGDHEARVFAPAALELGGHGVSVHGPIPADTVFARALTGEFDAVVAPYHDVGMAAFKTAAFGTGVNVTLGLPFVRTSPDHGTAFDLVDNPDRIDPGSMLEALRLAHVLCRNRFDTESHRV